MKALQEPDTSEINLSIVIPIYNERDSVEPLLDAIENTFAADSENRCEIILVDDGSRDGTFQEAVEHGQKGIVPTQVIGLQRNFGQTANLQTASIVVDLNTDQTQE
jgi:glycosyltransferase involved in cell wall biosynthesis